MAIGSRNACRRNRAFAGSGRNHAASSPGLAIRSWSKGNRPMTEAERFERAEAEEEADAALARAEKIRTRGARIAREWVQSRQDNNFRLMIRGLGQRAENG